MADHDDGRTSGREIALQPFDGRQIKMVGGLIEKQDVWRGCQHLRQRRAPGLAAGEAGGILVACQSELLEEEARLMGIVRRTEAGGDVGSGGRKAGKVGLLRKIANGRVRLRESRAAVDVEQPRGDLQERRLAGAVAADQADPLAGRDGELSPIEERRAAKGERDVCELKKGRGHRPRCISNGPVPRPVGIDSGARLGRRIRACRSRADCARSRSLTGRTVIQGELLDFVRTSIRSVWTLELLLFLWRSSNSRWTAAQLVQELRASDGIVNEGLASLQAAGLVMSEAGGTFRYAPASSHLDRLVGQLAQLYRERPTTVTKAIFSSPNDRLHTFADAFKLKKD